MWNKWGAEETNNWKLITWYNYKKHNNAEKDK